MIIIVNIITSAKVMVDYKCFIIIINDIIFLGGFKMAIDPVCLMEVDEKTAKFKTEYNGVTYYFCAPGCMKAFEKEPEKYLNKQDEE